MPEELILPPSHITRKHSLTKRMYESWMVSRWLSLDVAAGAMVCCLMACKVWQVPSIPWPAVLILAGTVLLIYTADHLQDVWHTAGKVFSPRRKFHWQYRHLLLKACLILTGILGVSVLLFLSLKIIVFGSMLAVLVVLYLWLVSKIGTNGGLPWFHKEVIIACLYTAGIWGVAGFSAGHLSTSYLYFVGGFFLIALQNLLLFSYFEREEDWLQGQRSMVINLGVRRVKRLLVLLFALSGLLLIIACTASLSALEKQVLFTEGCMSGVLLLLFIFPSFFYQHRRYRWLGDGIFLLPIWLLV
ncbi:hypothetical protein Q0590_10265 [Rhodocytophaga aerolata]|uniref:Prenyltransferase n=1 Tax=Rhodocytophaga aerolata TaxID=455078 RepID=A0ABT8R4L2_9BACT|nr:hypothetical protein [Rhodocytophaga aerolata]MDO1446636.1 hypothetical protein [Rhodocytophaga aerolata]